MPMFRYTFVDASGKRDRGTMDAPSAAVLADHLHKRNHFLLRADQVGGGGRLADILNADITFTRGLPKSAIAQMTRELAVMLEAGQDIDRALRFLVETAESTAARNILQSLRDQVRGGKSLAASLADHPKVFSRLYISLVRASEAGGQLAPGLSHLADLLERENKLTASIQSAMVYPVLLIAASIGTVLMLLTYVLPQFTPIFQQAGARLPTQTRLLIAIGDFVRVNGVWLLLLVVVLCLAGYRALQDRKVRLAGEKLIAKIPVAGDLVRKGQAARLTRTLGTLLQNGVGLVGALGISRDVLSNLTAAGIIEQAQTKVTEGGRLASALGADGFFPLQTIHLLQLGEETGRLGEMSLRAADIHDEQVHQVVQRLVSLMVPVITIVMGIVVAAIVGSLLVAMLSLNDLAT